MKVIRGEPRAYFFIKGVTKSSKEHVLLLHHSDHSIMTEERKAFANEKAAWFRQTQRDNI